MEDIWSSGILTFESPLKDLLDTEEYTLEDLLDEDELLQEVKACNLQLKSFFNEEKNVAGLVQCLLRIPPKTMPPPPPLEPVPTSSQPSSSKNSNDSVEIDEMEDGNLEADKEVNNEKDDAGVVTTTIDPVKDEINDHNNTTTPSIINESNMDHYLSNDDKGEDDLFSQMESMQQHPTTLDEEEEEAKLQRDEKQQQQGNNQNNNDSSKLYEINIADEDDTTTATILQTGNNDDNKKEGEKNESKEPTRIVGSTQNDTADINISQKDGTETKNDVKSEIEPSSSQPAPGDWLLDNITEKIETKKNHQETSSNNDDTNVKSSSSTTTSLTREEYERIYLRYPYIACEVICCENEDILDIIVYGSTEIDDDTGEEDVHNSANDNHEEMLAMNGSSPKKQSILDMLFSILYTTPPSQLDDRRAGYLEKILSVLFRTRPKAMESYLNGDHLLLLDSAKDVQNSFSSDVGNTVDDHSHICESDILHRGGGLSLLDALFDHLHSNSITQIVQRLLMPRPPSNKGLNDNEETNEGDSANQNGWDGNNSSQSDTDGEEYDDENLITSGVEEFGNVNCNWSDGEYAINLLLERLLGESNELDDLLDEGIVGSSHTSLNGNFTLQSEGDGITRFDCAQNASEILISIIQHSTLSSNVMKILTNKTVLSRLIECSCYTDSQRIEMRNTNCNASDSFSRHRSTMTTSMSVLESLILQLGGYGTVPTTPLYQVNNQEAVEDNEAITTNEEKECVEQDAQQLTVSISQSSLSVEANASNLIAQLPTLLQRLSILLKHPNTENWKSPVQYSSKPQQLLGASRLQIVRLLESLVLLGKREVDRILCQFDCLQTCLVLFWDFPWCSMLHQSVANLLVHVLEGGNERCDLQHYFLYKCNLVESLMESFSCVNKTEETNFSSTTNNNLNKNEKSEIDPDYETVLESKNDQNHSNSASGIVSATEDGNDFSTQANGVDSIPVSDDDVDAAMEHEELDNLNANMVPSESKNPENLMIRNEESTTEPTTDVGKMSNPSQVNLRNELEFRIGYMGHVIIICQAIVHACGVNDQDTVSNEENQNEDAEAEIPGNEINVGSHLSNEGNDSDADADTGPEQTQSSDASGVKSLLRGHSKYSNWMEFVSSTLASETAVQSTPLGGANENESNAIIDQGETISFDSGHIDHDMNGEHFEQDSVEKSKGTYSCDDDIDLDNTKFDDAEVDIAAKLMENITLPTPPINGVDEGMSSNTSGSHHRRKGVLGGEGAGNGPGQEFGTVVQMHKTSEEYYQYDDPLGGWQHQFPDDLAFEGKDFADSGNIDDNETENDVPVLDLFTGNMNFDNTEGKDDTGWANFDEAFSDYNGNDDAKIIDSSPDLFDSKGSNFINDDFFNEDKPTRFDLPFDDDQPPESNGDNTNSYEKDSETSNK